MLQLPGCYLANEEGAWGLGIRAAGVFLNSLFVGNLGAYRVEFRY